jgi:predicted peptidase
MLLKLILPTTVAVLALVESLPLLAAVESKPIDATLLRRFEARVFTNAAGMTLRYRLFRPAIRDAGTSYPLVLFLHGAAGLGDDNARQFNGGNEVPPLALTADDAQARHPCYVLAPQCPRGSSWSTRGRQPSETLAATLAALGALQREFRIDTNRIYVIGVSMGGHGVWDAVAKFPKTFAAAVPMCAASELPQAARIAPVPVWCFHGADDRLISVSHARQMMAALRKTGGQPKYTEYPGVGHDCYRNAFKEPELLPWLFAQKRGG